MRVAIAFVVAFAAAFLVSCSHGRCYTSDDCHHGKVCMAVDDTGRVLVKPDKCPKGSVLCGLRCVDPCGEGSCAEGEACTAGCCEQKRECRLNSECPGDQLCRGGKCLEAGQCHAPVAAEEG